MKQGTFEPLATGRLSDGPHRASALVADEHHGKASRAPAKASMFVTSRTVDCTPLAATKTLSQLEACQYETHICAGFKHYTWIYLDTHPSHGGKQG